MIAPGRTRYWLVSTILLYFASCLIGQDEKTPPPLFKVSVDTVYVKVAVADRLNRYVTGLQKQHFKIYEDNVEQTIQHFSQPLAPVSLGIVFDVSGSMGFDDNIRIGKSWLASLLRTSFLETRNPEDEYSLITFNQKVNLVQAFEETGAEALNDVALQKPGGWTALYDAVYRGLDHLKEAKNEKKALILITDGEENKSRYSWSEVRDLSTESDVQIYGLGLSGPEGYGHRNINDLIGLTGGRVFFGSYADLGYYFDLIHAELRTQYLLSYIPTNPVHDGKWRRIRIKLDPPPGTPKLSIRARDGYYARKF